MLEYCSVIQDKRNLKNLLSQDNFGTWEIFEIITVPPYVKGAEVLNQVLFWVHGHYKL